DRLSACAARVLRELAAYYNRRAVWPTCGELTRWMFEHADVARDDPRLVAPRLTELSRGRRTRPGEYAGGHVIEALPVRRCHVTGATAHPWRIREKGSAEPRC